MEGSREMRSIWLAREQLTVVGNPSSWSPRLGEEEDDCTAEGGEADAAALFLCGRWAQGIRKKWKIRGHP